MKSVEVGRKTRKVSRAQVVIATGLATGVTLTVAVNRLRLGVAQIAQECRAAFALSGCECTACTVPSTNTSNTQRTAVVLMNGLRFAHIRCMTALVGFLILNLDEQFGTEEARRRFSAPLEETRRPSGRLVGPRQILP
ncbi:MAG TPA: hypothetical protein VGV15_06380 [Terriglobales bacterium]|nr:hypothetical protein [Terriglobales bacterium]